jgi:steroid 5-alpha reductase family enzyme
MSVPWFYWVSFALFAAGVISYALQLVLTKLALLAQLKFNLAEILSDALGLLISVVGLVLTTQAATQNSNFTTSPAMVLSSAAVGLIAGFLFFRWGHKLEVRAAKANQATAPNPGRERLPM